eukprot:8858940-Pyramimonas_sp.AAC.1
MNTPRCRILGQGVSPETPSPSTTAELKLATVSRMKGLVACNMKPSPQHRAHSSYECAKALHGWRAS